RTWLLRNLAMLAIATDKSLRQYAGQRGIDEIRLDANLDKTRNSLRRTVRMQRGKYQVASECALDRNLRSLSVTNLTDQNDVGVVTQDVSQRLGKTEVDSGVNLDLHDAVEAVFDRIFDGHDVILASVQLLQSRIQRRRLTRSRRSRDKHQPLIALDQRPHPTLVGRGKADVDKPAQPDLGVENADDHILAVHRGHHRAAHVD